MCGPLEIDCAIRSIQQIKEELETAKDEARSGKLPQPIHQSLHNSVTELTAASKAVGSSMAQLVMAANQGNDNFTGIAAKDTAKTLGVLATAVKGVASFSKDPQTQAYIIATAQQLMDESVALVSEAKQAIKDPSAPDKQLRLARAAKSASQALSEVVNCLPGLIDIDQSLKDLEEASLILQSGKVSQLECHVTSYLLEVEVHHPFLHAVPGCCWPELSDTASQSWKSCLRSQPGQQ